MVFLGVDLYALCDSIIQRLYYFRSPSFTAKSEPNQNLTISKCKQSVGHHDEEVAYLITLNLFPLAS